MDRVQHIDFGARRSLSCSTYRQSFSMLDGPGLVKRRTPVSRFRSIAPVVGLILVIAGCSPATPSAAASAGPSTAASAPAASAGTPASAGPATPAPSPGVQGRQRQPADVQRPAGRRAAPAARARLRGAHRRPRQRHRGRLPDDLRQGAARRVDRHEQLRRLRLRPAVDGRLRRPRLPAGPDRPGQGRHDASSGRTSGRSSAISTRPTTARSTRSRSMATSTWSITGATS